MKRKKILNLLLEILPMAIATAMIIIGIITGDASPLVFGFLLYFLKAWIEIGRLLCTVRSLMDSIVKLEDNVIYLHKQLRKLQGYEQQNDK